MKNKFQKMFICCLLIISVFGTMSYAAVGRHSSSSSSRSSRSSSSSGYSSSSSHGYSSSSSPSYHSGTSFHYVGFGGSSFGGVGGLFSLIFMLIIFAVIFTIIIKAMKYRNYNSGFNELEDDPHHHHHHNHHYDDEPYQNYDQPVQNVSNRSEDNSSLQLLKEKDPLFSEVKFIDKVNNMFMQLQKAWSEKKWNSVRPFETDTLFNLHNKQLQELIDQGITNKVENIAILNTRLLKYSVDGDIEFIDAELQTRYNDYDEKDSTGEIVRGSKYEDIYMTYTWRLIRKSGVITKAEEQKSITQCPNCGSNLSINASGQCDYCGSVVSNGDFDWVLASITV